MKKLLAVLALSVTSTVANAATELLINGSFEDIGGAILNPGQWTTFPSIPGWSLESGPGIEVRNNVSGDTDFGNYFVELDAHPAPGDTTIFQNVNTTAGQVYNLSFAYSPRVNLPDTTNGINVFWNDIALTANPISGNGGSQNIWTIFSFQVTGTGGLNKLSFASVADADTLGGNIDNVSLMAAVPEPSTYGMMFAGLALIGFTARRRKL